MDLNEYIKMSYERPNRKVLEGLGASEGLIEYLMETPGNTNWNVVDSIINSGGGGEPEVWLVGDTYEDYGERIFMLSNVGDTDYKSELLTNGENYNVYLNGEELPYFTRHGDNAIQWTDSAEDQSMTKMMAVATDALGSKEASAYYMDTSIAPTSVEVSVKAK